MIERLLLRLSEMILQIPQYGGILAREEARRSQNQTPASTLYRETPQMQQPINVYDDEDLYGTRQSVRETPMHNYERFVHMRAFI